MGIRIDNWIVRLKEGDSHNLISERAVRQLINISAEQVRVYFRRSTPPSPAVQAREFEQLSKSLSRAAKAFQAIGEHGLIRLYVASGANSDIENFQFPWTYLLPMAQWAHDAAKMAAEEKAAHIGGKRGPTGDPNLRSLVVVAHQYSLLLGLKPLHTRSESGVGQSLFEEFVKAAMADFAPDGVRISWTKIDRTIAEELVFARKFWS